MDLTKSINESKKYEQIIKDFKDQNDKMLKAIEVLNEREK